VYQLDDVCVFSRVLSPAEIRAVMNGEIDSNSPDLKLFYNFNDGDSDNTRDILDSSSNGHNAVITGDVVYEVDDVSVSVPSYSPNYSPIADYSLKFHAGGQHAHLDFTDTMSTYTIAMQVRTDFLDQEKWSAYFNTFSTSKNGF